MCLTSDFYIEIRQRLAASPRAEMFYVILFMLYFLVLIVVYSFYDFSIVPKKSPLNYYYYYPCL